jgi:hypothetical protein
MAIERKKERERERTTLSLFNVFYVITDAQPGPIGHDYSVDIFFYSLTIFFTLVLLDLLLR